jgi:hypothetical protein
LGEKIIGKVWYFGVWEDIEEHPIPSTQMGRRIGIKPFTLGFADKSWPQEERGKETPNF